MKIYLVGMPGSGKSTLGKVLAEALMVEFVDLDSEIEKQEKKMVSEIFREKGEDYFRLTESEILKLWASSSKSFVMATGGGAPCFYHGIDIINKTGIGVFIDVPVKDIVKRLKFSNDRPLLHAKDEVEREERLNKIRDSRLSIYSKAAIKLHNPTATELLNSVRIKN